MIPQLPVNNAVISVRTTNYAVDPNRSCRLCERAQAMLGNWVCQNCIGYCWSCRKPGGILRSVVYWTCNECESSQKCLFCELTDVAASFHYGAPSCETCKGRYRSYMGLKTGKQTTKPKLCDKLEKCANLSDCTGCWATKWLPVWKDISKFSTNVGLLRCTKDFGNIQMNNGKHNMVVVARNECDQ